MASVNILLIWLREHSSQFSRSACPTNKVYMGPNVCPQLLYISVIFYCVGLIALKTSILFQYLRFFVDKTFRALAWALMAVVVIGGSVLVLTSSLSCLPVAFNWDKTIVGGHCLNQPPLWYFMAGFTIVTDIAVLILPMPVLLGLHLPKRQKYSLMATFGLGTLYVHRH